MTNVELAVSFSRVLVAVCTAIGAIEYLSIRSQFTGSGIFSADVHVLNWIRGPRLAVHLYRCVFSYNAAIISQVARLGLALALILPLDMKSHAAILALLFLLQIHTLNLSPVGHDGSDQMILVVTPALAVAYAFRLNGPCAWVPLWFIVTQALLAYATSGISKLISPVWRSGQALRLISNTACYGSHRVSRWLTKVQSLGLLGSWAVILFECAMPFALIVPRDILILMLAVALLFHLGCAVVMGLNCFIWAFASTYPLIFVFRVERSFALTNLKSPVGANTEFLLGVVLAVLIVSIVLIRYYEILRPLHRAS